MGLVQVVWAVVAFAEHSMHTSSRTTRNVIDSFISFLACSMGNPLSLTRECVLLLHCCTPGAVCPSKLSSIMVTMGDYGWSDGLITQGRRRK